MVNRYYARPDEVMNRIGELEGETGGRPIGPDD